MRRDVRNRSGRQRLEERQLLAVVPFVEDVLLQVGVRWEVDRREGDVAEQARARALVQPKKAELAYDVHSAFRHSSLELGRLTLHLKTNFPENPRSARPDSTLPKPDAPDDTYTISSGFVKICDTRQ